MTIPSFLYSLRSACIGSALVAVPVNPLLQGDWLNHPRCPTVDTSVSWVDYITEKVPIVPGTIGNGVTVEFAFFKKQGGDRAAIGGLSTKPCYTLYWLPQSRYGRPVGWESQAHGHGQGPNRKSGLPGNPLLHELNVHGVRLLFNDAGEVMDWRARVVGRLSCYRSVYRCQDY